jgi:ribosome-associated protein
VKVPPDEMDFSFVRSSGPGGQNVNKVNSKAVLRWNALESRALGPEARARLFEKLGSKLTAEGELLVTSDRFRDQGRNREDCIEKLELMLAQALTRPKARKKTKPTYSSKRRKLEAKGHNSEKKRNRKFTRSGGGEE